ncbi:hypothetical protein QE152_g7663 [Popillia japonica]|uniref:Uncharacterized protein n=1 Tax=Popillia japonica TaxID=7064 RepID=A0AAW1MCQ5_POPJA
MANVPCTLLVKSLNEVDLPQEMLYVICKQLFRYGVRALSTRGAYISVSLTYSPKGETLTKKFGNLPIEYVRLALETTEEINLFEEGLKRFKFQLRDDNEIEDGPSLPKIKCNVIPKANESTKHKKVKMLENRLLKPASSTSIREVIREVYDDDALDFNSQKFHYEVL